MPETNEKRINNPKIIDTFTLRRYTIRYTKIFLNICLEK